MVNEYVREYKIGSGSYGKVVCGCIIFYLFTFFKGDDVVIVSCATGSLPKSSRWKALCN